MTAYEIRISDCSSYVCSSDLHYFFVDDVCVDGKVDGLPNAFVLEGILAFHVGLQQFLAMLVETDKDGARLGLAQDFDVRDFFQAWPVLYGYGAHKKIGRAHV